MTTDTALLVSHEILEGGVELENLTFVEDPQVPMSDSVVRYLDVLMPINQIAESGFDFKTASQHIAAFTEACKSKQLDETVQESTIMEGFRYRVDDTQFPVFNGPNQLNKGSFPILPIGMLDIWRE